MILFAPSYDEPTQANHAVAAELAAATDTLIAREMATAEALIAALRVSCVPVMLMSHGTRRSVLGHGGLAALNGDDVELQPHCQRVFFAHACETANELGGIVSGHGGTWWGYNVLVASPDDSPAALPVFIELFQFIRERFPETRTRADQDQFFADMARACRVAAGKLDELFDKQALDSAQGMLCVTQIEHDLLVWSAGATTARSAGGDVAALPPRFLFLNGRRRDNW